MRSEWEVMRAISDVQGDQNTVAKLIEDIDFSGLRHAQAMALEVFELTRDNVRVHIAAAKKAACFNEAAGLHATYRLALLRELIAELEGKCFTQTQG